MFELLAGLIVLLAGVAWGLMPAKRIYYVGNLAGNYIRFKPNFGFQLGSLKWSKHYGRGR